MFKLNQAEFAEELRLSRGYISEVESGKKEVSQRILDAMELHYRVNPAWLARGEEPMVFPGDVSMGCNQPIWGGPETQPAPPEEGQPPHGHDFIRLPRGDNRRLGGREAEVLERALVVLRATGRGQGFAIGLTNNVDNFFDAVQLANEHNQSQNGKREKAG